MPSALANAKLVQEAKSEPKERSGVQSLERAFSMLEVISEHEHGIALAELSKIVGLHNSTAFHLVRTMVNRGYVQQDGETKKYRTGRMIHILAAKSRSEFNLGEIARPILEDISQVTGESAHLAVFEANEVTIVTKTAGTGAFQLNERHGTSRPGHATAIGKILLAAQTEDKLAHYLSTHDLTALTGRTITEKSALMRELGTVCENGIAFDDGEYHDEVRCVAVPVIGHSGTVCAAIGISGPVWRVSLQSLNSTAATLAKAASKLTGELNGSNVRF